MPNDLSLIDLLANAIAERVRAPIPLAHDYWSVKEIAQVLKFKEAYVMSNIVCKDGFPKPRRMPSSGPGRGHPRWLAEEVIEWIEKHAEKN